MLTFFLGLVLSCYFLFSPLVQLCIEKYEFCILENIFGCSVLGEPFWSIDCLSVKNRCPGSKQQLAVLFKRSQCPHYPSPLQVSFFLILPSSFHLFQLISNKSSHFSEHLLCVSHCPKFFTCFISFSL